MLEDKVDPAPYLKVHKRFLEAIVPFLELAKAKYYNIGLDAADHLQVGHACCLKLPKCWYQTEFCVARIAVSSWSLNRDSRYYGPDTPNIHIG